MSRIRRAKKKRMAAECLVDSQAVLVRCLLFFDCILFFLFALAHTRRGSDACGFVLKKIVTLGLFFTLFMVFVLSYVFFADIQFDASTQLVGILGAALFSVVQLIEKLAVVGKILMTSVLLIAAQLSNTYLPDLMHSNLRMSIETAEALVLLVPFCVLVLLEMSLGNRVFATTVVCMVLSVLLGLSISVGYQDGFDFTSNVCCDLNAVDGCPLFWPFWDTYIILLAFIALLYLCIADCMRKTQRCCRRSCCCCCCKEKRKEKETETDKTKNKQKLKNTTKEEEEEEEEEEGEEDKPLLSAPPLLPDAGPPAKVQIKTSRL